MKQTVGEANSARGSDLFRILKPKQAIQRAKFGAHSPLPGVRDREGNWCKDRGHIAMAWERQFEDLETANAVTIQELWQKSQPQHKPRRVADLLEIPDPFDLEEALRSMNPAKATGVDATGAEIWKQDICCNARAIPTTS